MHLRPMHLGDLPDLADLSAEAQFEDELTDFIVPYRRDYYTSYRNSFLRRMRARRLRPGWIYWVAETDEGDEPTTMQKQKGEKELGGRVIGYAAWLREGQSPVARNWQKINEEWFIKLEACLAELQNRYWTFFKLDRSEESSRRAALLDLFEHTFDRDIFTEVWYLENLVVHTDYQRRGIGAHLVKWGLTQAEAESVPCGVESSFAGLRLYEKMGFRKVNDMRYGDRERETMAVMVWEPSGMQGRWFKRAKAGCGEASGVDASKSTGTSWMEEHGGNSIVP